MDAFATFFKFIFAQFILYFLKCDILLIFRDQATLMITTKFDFYEMLYKILISTFLYGDRNE